MKIGRSGAERPIGRLRLCAAGAREGSGHMRRDCIQMSRMPSSTMPATISISIR